MKILIFLLVFLVTTFTQAQQSIYYMSEIDSVTGHFIGETYTKWVGNADKKFPLTVAGLDSAISNLDSGIVYISYPGLWDTTGLGAIPSAVKIYGWLFGRMVTTSDQEIAGNNKSLHIGKIHPWNWWTLEETLLGVSRTYATTNTPVSAIGNYITNLTTSAVEALRIQTVIGQDDSTNLLNGVSIGGLIIADLFFEQVNQPNFDFVGLDFNLKQDGLKDVGDLYGTRIGVRFNGWEDGSGNMADVYVHRALGVEYWNNASGRITGDYWAFRSDSLGLSWVGGTAFHFYGEGSFPSYLGGDLRLLGNLTGTNTGVNQYITIDDTSPEIIINSLTITLGDTDADGNETTIELNDATNEISLNGDVVTQGFTTLGNASIKVKKLTGTTGATEGSTSDVAHGLTSTKIIGITALVYHTSGQAIQAEYTFNAEYQFSCYFNGTNVTIANATTNSANILSKPFTVLVTYEE